MRKQLFIFDLKVSYEVSKDGVLLISFYSPYVMTDQVKKRMIAKIGNYLISEGFLENYLDTGAVV